MELIRNILDHKGYVLHTAAAAMPLSEALRLMADRNVGSLLVFEGHELSGILTERDYVRWMVRRGAEASRPCVRDAMDQRVERVTPDQRVDEAMQRMTQKRVRHLAVEEQGRIVGLVSIGDVVHAVISSQANEIDHLHRYIHGEGAAPPSS